LHLFKLVYTFCQVIWFLLLVGADVRHTCVLQRDSDCSGSCLVLLVQGEHAYACTVYAVSSLAGVWQRHLLSHDKGFCYWDQ
jgi:hypothetical protein